MAEDTRQDAQQRRAEGREQRRSMLTEPFERLSDAASGGEGSSKSEVRETVKRAALTAAVAAAIGAAAGAAKTMLDRRSEGGDEQQADEEPQGRSATADDEYDDQAEGRAEALGDEDDGASLEDAADADSEPGTVVPRARRELERLLGREAESVSGFERDNGHWKVNLEVVELRRIPDSSDVLGSYELVLDDKGKVARMTRTRRYQRSEVEAY